MRYWLFWSVGLLLWHCAAQPPPLFDDGRSVWRIQLGVNADPTEAYAADELRQIVRAVSGVELPILRTDAPPESGTVVIGSPATTPAVAAVAGELELNPADPVEELAVHTDGDVLYLAGNQPRGALFAVYDFARRELGVRWFWSDGDDGTFFPPQKSFSVPELKRNYQPAIPYRGFHLCGQQIDPAFEYWMSRNFLNIMRSHPYADYNADQRKHGMHIMYSNHFVNLPHPLDLAMQRMDAPSSGFRPLHPEAWHVLAAIRSQNQGNFPYLIWRSYGQGLLVVTSADCGASGGSAIFGNEQLESVVWLLDNLRQLEDGAISSKY